MVVLGEPEADRAAGLRRQLAHPRDLAGGSEQVLAHDPGGSELDDPGAELTQHAADAEQLVFRGERARHRLAVHRGVHGGAGGRKAKRTSLNRGPDDVGHRSDVLGRGGLVTRSPLAHDVRAYRAVRHLRGDVDRARHLLDRVEVVGESLPAPLDALGQRAARDVLDALHQLDEPLLAARAYRRESHAAIAHDDRRDPVPRRRGEQRIPADLTVVMGVDVDEPGGDDEPVGVDRAPGGGSRKVTDLGDDAVVDRHVGSARGISGAIHQGAGADDEVVHEASKAAT